MPLNLLKKYSELLDIAYLEEAKRTNSLTLVFKRDIEDNPEFSFRGKRIRPIKEDGPSIHTLLKHLTTEVVQEIDDKGIKNNKRIFEMHRSQRIHWIRHHIEEKMPDNIIVFSAEDRVDNQLKKRTYIYDKKEQYVIILEPQRSNMDYYLLTAYYLNRKEGKKTIEKKLRRKLDQIA